MATRRRHALLLLAVATPASSFGVTSVRQPLAGQRPYAAVHTPRMCAEPPSLEQQQGRSLRRALRSTAASVAFCAASLFAGSVSIPRANGAGTADGGSALARLVGAKPALAAESAVAPATKQLGPAAQKRLKLVLKRKLAKVPVFMVTNEGGSPFLNQLSSGDQSALMFLFPEEAERMLKGVLKAPNGATSGAKVLATNLDRAFKLARLEPMASGLRDQVTGRDLTMVWQFMPHGSEQRAAQFLLAKTGKLSPPAMPGYVVEGLVLKKRGKEVRPVFLCKKDVDAALAGLAASGDAADAKVIVYDALGYLLGIATDIEAGDTEVEAELDSFELVPPSESVDFRDRLKRDKPTMPAKIVPPDPRLGPF